MRSHPAFFEPTNIIREIYTFKHLTNPVASALSSLQAAPPTPSSTSTSSASTSAIESPLHKKPRRSTSVSSESLASFSSVMKECVRDMKEPPPASTMIGPQTGKEFLSKLMLRDSQKESLAVLLELPVSTELPDVPLEILASFEAEHYESIGLSSLQRSAWIKLSDSFWTQRNK